MISRLINCACRYRNFLILIIIFPGCRNNNQSALISGIAEKNPASGNPCNLPQKIIVYKDYVYDLSGYEDEGKGKPFNLFDENAFVDPRAESKTSENYIPVTNPQPTAHPAIYFPLTKGSRIVTDLRVPYKLSEVYLYDHSYSSDSVWFYTGDMGQWKLKAALVTKGNAGMWGWRRFLLDDSSEYVMIRFSNFQTSINEMVLYGCPYKSVPPPPSSVYNGPRIAKKMMKDFLGVNYFNAVDPTWVKPFHYSRLYTFAMDFDSDNVNAYPKNTYNMLHNGHWDKNANDYSFFMDKVVKKNGAIVWYSIMGLPLWMNKKKLENLRPVTEVAMDPENPLSYARHGRMMWNIAAFFGNTKIDSNLLSVAPGPKRSGRGITSLYENGNEDDATWVGDKYCSPVEYFAQSSADYDGHESALGKTIGIKNADPASRLMTSGMIELDTNRVRVLKFLCNTLRKDKKFIWDGAIQYHHYCTDGKHGITPEEDSLRWKLAKVREATYRYQPDAPCFLGENGYDKSQLSRQGTPLLPGLSEGQCQGIFILRSINATAFSGFDAYILYWLRDAGIKDDPSVYLTSGVLRESPDGKIEPLPAWFYISTFVNTLGNYVADDVVSEKGKVWIYKYRNKISPDSVAYFIYCPTRNGTKYTNYPLNVGTVARAEAREISLDDNSSHGSSARKKIVNGVVTLNVGESPKIVLVNERK
jgi:hypothetical protein